MDGIGVRLLPRVVADRDLAEGRLRLLEVEPVPPPLRFTASHLGTPGSGLPEAVAGLARRVANTP